MNGPLITAEELLDRVEADAALDKYAAPLAQRIRSWYDFTLAERSTKRDTIKTPVGDLVVGKTYDIVEEYQSTRALIRGQSGQKTRTLRGYTVHGRAQWSDHYINVSKPTAGSSYGRSFRELSPDRIRQITEVPA